MFINDTVLSIDLFLKMPSEVGPLSTSNKALCHTSQRRLNMWLLFGKTSKKVCAIFRPCVTFEA